MIGAGLYLTVLGIFALAIGALIRHTAGAISTVIGLILVLPILAGPAPQQLGSAHPRLPSRAGRLADLSRPADIELTC